MLEAEQAEVLWEKDEDLQEMQGCNSQENSVLLVTCERRQPALTLELFCRVYSNKQQASFGQCRNQTEQQPER